MRSILKFEYCKPVNAKTVPTGDDWIHEIEYDGYRGRIVRDGKDVRLLSRSGLDWAWRFPWICRDRAEDGAKPIRNRRRDMRIRRPGHFRFRCAAFEQAQRRGAAVRVRPVVHRWRGSARRPLARSQGPTGENTARTRAVLRLWMHGL